MLDVLLYVLAAYVLLAGVALVFGERMMFQPPPAGYDRSADNSVGQPFYSPGGPGQWARHVVESWFTIWDLGKPVIAQVHGYCLAGGSELAACCDLVYVAEDARIGYPPTRVWGVPTTALWAFRIGPARAKRLLLTGDSIDGATAVEWGLATEAAPAAKLDEAFEALLERIARVPVNQLVMHKLLVNQALYSQGLQATQVLGTVFDGIARHTPEGFAFQQRAAEAGFKEAVRERDEPFGDYGLK